MAGIDSFLLNSLDEIDSMLGTVEMVIEGQTFDVVIDDAGNSTKGDDIGLVGEFDLIACAQPSDVTTPRLLVNKRCTVDGVAYRVGSVRSGTIAIHFMLTNAAK